MVSCKTKSPHALAKYHEQDNYHQQLGQYRGMLKDELGLNDLDYSSYKRMCYGYNPLTGERVIQKRGGKQKERGGIDWVCSAPKSVSVALEIAIAKGDTKLAILLQKCHDSASNTAFDHLEKNYSNVRVQKKGKQYRYKTGKLVAAKFQHDVSREVDPQLHTHFVIMNFTKDKDGKFRSLNASEILKSNKSNGLIYRNQLAHELKKAGIEITVTDLKQGFFELKGVQNELLSAMSKRRNQIENDIEKMKAKYPKASEKSLAQMACIGSRKFKSDVNRDEVREANIKAMENVIGVNGVSKLLSQIQPKVFPKKLPKVDLEKEVKKIRAKISPKQYHFDEKTASKAMVLNFGDISSEKLITEIKRQDEVEKTQMKTMNELLVEQLTVSKLNVEKLFLADKKELNERIEIGRDSIEYNTNRRSERERTIDRTHSSNHEYLQTAKHDIGATYSGQER